jgi:hypothetical protein
MDSEIIKNAIKRSRQYNEIVRCEVADSGGLETILRVLYGCEVLEHIGWTEDNRGILDACGRSWRLTITCNDLIYQA